MNKLKKLSVTILNLLKIYKQPHDYKEYSEGCIILGNGPSLTESINKNKIPQGIDKVCVNYFALSQYYEKIRPKHYFLSDPFFFKDKILPLSKIDKFNKINSNESMKSLIMEDYAYLERQRDKLLDNINTKTKWKMVLHLPIHYCQSSLIKKISNKNIRINYFSQMPLGIKTSKIRNLLYRSKLFMPLPQNILIATIAGIIRFGYKNIYIVGADHSWHEDFVLNDENILGINDRHFYDNENADAVIFKPLIGDFESGNLTRVTDQFYAQYLIFRSHEFLQSYAQSVGVRIINMSEKSYIDAYEKLNVKEVLN